jgi:hypothetical protein
MRIAVLAASLLVALGVTGCSHSKKPDALFPACPKPPSTASAGNAQIAAKALGNSYMKVVVVRATEKSNGAPVHNGKVSVYAQMSCPHAMQLYQQKLKETSPGTYKNRYQLVMPGQWAFYIVLRDKNGNATTSALPVTVKVPGA